MNAKHIIIISPLMLFISLFSSAQGRYELVPSSSLTELKGIEVEGVVNVKLEQGAEPIAYYDGSDSAVSGIKASVKNNILSINSSKGSGTIHIVHTGIQSIKMSAAVNLESVNAISAGTLRLNMSGACEARLEVDVKELDASVTGASHARISGKADSASVKVSGASHFEAPELLTARTYALITGASQAEVNASESLVGKVSGMSSISYSREPAFVDIDKSGSAEVVLGGLDTLKVKIGGQKIIIIEDMDKKVEKKTDDDDKEKKSKFNGHWGGLELHLNTYVNSDRQISVEDPYSFLSPYLSHSIGLNFNVFETNIPLAKKHLGLVTGLGWAYNNYRFDPDIVLRNDTSVIWADSNPIYTKSKLRVNSLTLPLLLEFQTNEKEKLNSFHVGAGMIFGFNVGARTKNMYFDNSERIKVKQRGDFHLSPFDAAATARIGWGRLNLFASYDLLPLFKAGEGPELYPVKFGITLVDW